MADPAGMRLWPISSSRMLGEARDRVLTSRKRDRSASIGEGSARLLHLLRRKDARDRSVSSGERERSVLLLLSAALVVSVVDGVLRDVPALGGEEGGKVDPRRVDARLALALHVPDKPDRRHGRHEVVGRVEARPDRERRVGVVVIVVVFPDSR